MTNGAPEGDSSAEKAVEISRYGDTAFSSLMEVLVPEEAPAAGGGSAGAAPAGADDGAGQAAPAAPAGADGNDGAAGGAPATPAAPASGDGAAAAGADGADGAAAGGAEQPPAEAGDGARPAAWTAPSTELIPKLGQLSVALEENTSKAYQATALEEVRKEHVNYFTALEKHPRLLVGTQVPAIGKEGTETLRDTNDAREWQDAVKTLLVAEVRDRASRQMEESADFLNTVHQSIELFQNNADLIPGSKDFDVELANTFATMAKPYEVRVDGKLQGYSIPVQPIIDQMRARLVEQRKAAPPAVTQPPAGAPSTQEAPASGPQAGIASKAGSGTQTEDFSALFGTLGLPEFRI